jgi:hypothetical protein
MLLTVNPIGVFFAQNQPARPILRILCGMNDEPGDCSKQQLLLGQIMDA